MSIWNQIKYAWMNGKIIEATNATVHISSPIVNTGAGVFEGIRAYFEPEKEQLYVFRLKDHIERLFNSARFHRMEIRFSKDELHDAVVKLLSVNEFKEDVYIRPLVYRGGKWSESSIDLAIYAVPRSSVLRTAQHVYRCCVSSWRRIPDNVMPPRIKTCGNYVHGSYARLEAEAYGLDEGIFLTVDGKVSEAPGANIFIVRKGVLATPSINSDILEGFTRETVLKLASEDLKFKTMERVIDRTELYVAEEIFLCGTGHEIIPVIEIDKLPVGEGKPGEITKQMKATLLAVVTGNVSRYRDWLTEVYN